MYAAIISLGFLLFPSQLLAAEDPKPKDDDTTNAAAESKSKDFLGLGFGTGISLTIDAFSGKDRVESASVVDGVVRIDEEQNTQARVVLESHYFFEPSGKTGKFIIGNVEKAKWGHGPFLAIQPGEDEIINAIGFGWMLGFRRADDTNQSWNFGLGYLVDPNAKVLGDGIEANQPLPGGETEIRYKTEGESSLLLVFSFAW